jgi:hypothetical protein
LSCMTGRRLNGQKSMSGGKTLWSKKMFIILTL